MNTAFASSEPGGIRPLWVPEHVSFDKLPPALQQAIVDIFNPAYEQLVLEAPTALERSTGLSYMHLLWLELVGQQEIGRAMYPASGSPADQKNAQKKISQYIALVQSKTSVGKFLLQIRKYNERPQNYDPLLASRL